ncbi:2,3-diaminopropionate biosynthesis protein SbnA [Kitasatospora sp. NPDC048365]|uniref:2,3-diaminopropionate biosynthesis protein SbnA n=1 Tax=Kitasatospora sp. NPDC048365 TaxID=3364050 RepID=UPI00371B9D55
MPVISNPQDFNEDELFLDLRASLGIPLYVKCEGLNFAGSIKQKAAVAMVEAAERSGLLGPDSILVESSSGNLGVALSMVAASRGYGFLCVTDSRCNLATRRLMEAFGARVHTVTDPTPDGGLLGARLDHVRRLLASDSRYVWLNQYLNPSNWQAHYRTTAPAIARQFPGLDVLFVGAGTTGTLMGCARWFHEHRPHVRIVAVDSVGSVIFGTEPGTRMIPGLGAGVRPPLLDESYIDEVVHVAELDTVRTCHRLAARGFLLGGSTGTVVSAADRWLAEQPGGGRDLTAVAISPDLGERYLDTVYQTNWVQELYGPQALEYTAGVVHEPA